MLDFNNILATPGADIQYFEGTSTATLTQWQVWKKPRGAKWIHLLGVGGGGGGGTGFTSGAGGAGAGGSSGAQTSVMIPAMFVPDILYIQAGAGGPGATVGATLGTAGTITYVCIEPYSTIAPAGTLLLANGGTVGAAVPTASLGGTAPASAPAAASLIGMCLAGRGFSTLLGGQQGIVGAGAGAFNGASITPPSTGLMVTGGAGGGSSGAAATGGNGGSIAVIANMLGTDFFSLPLAGGTGAASSIPATAASSGVVSRNFLFNFGGAGGGGGSTNAAGIPSAGGDGAPGCGGGGAGCTGSGAVSIARGGNGGAGFVYIISI